MNAAAALIDRFGEGDGLVTARAPGRINLIGEHTDYNEGFVLPAIISCHVEVALRRRPGQTVRMLAADLDEMIEYRLVDPSDPDWPCWAPYLAGLVEELRIRGFVKSGFDLAVHGTVPRASGLSSSAALEIAAALAFSHAFEFDLTPLAMAQLCRDVEHNWVGVRCGIMDQMVCRLGKPDHALLIDCRDLSHRHVPLNLRDHSLIITDSGVQRQLVDSAYNERRRECELGTDRLRRLDPAIQSLRDVEPRFLDAHADDLPPLIADRCRHVVDENARVLAGEIALAVGDLRAFGDLMQLSHVSLRDLYAASHPTVDLLVDAAMRVPGVLGSRLTGAGWGGCTVTLCTNSAVDPFRRRMEDIFKELSLAGSVMLAGPSKAAGISEVRT